MVESRTQASRLRIVPKVDQLLLELEQQAWAAGLPRHVLVREVQQQVALLRASLLKEAAGPADRDEAVGHIREQVRQALQPLLEASLLPVINATGVVLHTNLGRARLGERAVQAVAEAAARATNLEFDLERGRRTSRMGHLDTLLCRLFDCEAALAVNNNAAALLLAIDTLGQAGVVVSRGEQVEIGDSFRLPDILKKAGVPIHEVGTTNRTRPEDYVAVVDRPGLVFLKVHRSNFALHGYTSETSVEELVQAARSCDATVVYDLGSGSYESLEEHGLHGEPDVRRALAAGAPVVTMSGDKLLGGPQAGILAGAKDSIEPMRRNPLARALRIDKLSLAALQATLLSYANEGAADVPTMSFILSQPAAIETRARRLHHHLRGRLAAKLQVEPSQASVGGGSFADMQLPSYELRVWPETTSANELLGRLRRGRPAVVARIKDDHVGVDLRCVTDAEVPVLAQALEAAVGTRGRVAS